MTYEALPQVPEVALSRDQAREARRRDRRRGGRRGAGEPRRLGQRPTRTGRKGSKAKDGDQVVIDFKGTVDGEPFEGGAAEDFPLVLGSKSFIPGFEDQLVGAKAGDELEVKVTFPEKLRRAAPRRQGGGLRRDGQGGEGAEARRDRRRARQALRRGDARRAEGADPRPARRRVRPGEPGDPEAAADGRARRAGRASSCRRRWSTWRRSRSPTSSGTRSTPTTTATTTTRSSRPRSTGGSPSGGCGSGCCWPSSATSTRSPCPSRRCSARVFAQARQYPGQERQFLEFVQKNPQALQQIRAPLFEEKVVDFILELAAGDREAGQQGRAAEGDRGARRGAGDVHPRAPDAGAPVTRTVTFFVTTARSGTQWLTAALREAYGDALVSGTSRSATAIARRRRCATPTRSGRWRASRRSRRISRRSAQASAPERPYVEVGFPAYALAPVLREEFGEALRLVQLTRPPGARRELAGVARLVPARPARRPRRRRGAGAVDTGVSLPAYGARWPSMTAFEKALYYWFQVHDYAREVEADGAAGAIRAVRLRAAPGRCRARAPPFARAPRPRRPAGLARGCLRRASSTASPARTAEPIEPWRIAAHPEIVALAEALGYGIAEVDAGELERRYRRAGRGAPGPRSGASPAADRLRKAARAPRRARDRPRAPRRRGAGGAGDRRGARSPSGRIGGSTDSRRSSGGSVGSDRLLRRAGRLRVAPGAHAAPEMQTEGLRATTST